MHVGKVNGLTLLCESLYLNSTAAAQDVDNSCLPLSIWKHCCVYIGWSIGSNAGWGTGI